MQRPQNEPTSRRDFMKQSTTVAVGAGLLGALSPRAFAKGEDTVRVGLVGAGGRGGGGLRRRRRLFTCQPGDQVGGRGRNLRRPSPSGTGRSAVGLWLRSRPRRRG